MTYEQKLNELAQENENIFVMTAENRAAIRNLPEQLGGRFIDVGIAEQTMVGAAAGLALRGRIPVVHALATFLTMRAFEFIRTDIGIGKLPVKLVGAVPGFLSEANGPTHQAIEDIALMRGIPSMHIFCPTDRDELVDAMEKVVATPSPCYIRYNEFNPSITHTVPFEWGKAELVSDGDDVTVLTYGFLLKEALVAKDVLSVNKMTVRLVNLRSLSPIDEEIIIESARRTKLLVTVEDHFLTGGLYSIVAEILVRNNLACRVIPIALEERWFHPALLGDVLTAEGFGGRQ
ncbi:MAG TPA: transketolase C-terminal domain-containing protein, partial [Bacteroidota bacterium]|nr:transketolase C-terminal domain-containing protein [Bacteroidota bacterium]